MSRTTALFLVAVVIIGTLGFLFFQRSVPPTTNGSGPDPRLHVDFERSAVDNPIFVSSLYGFEYSPSGQYSQIIGIPAGAELFQASIVSPNNDPGIALSIYRNDTGIDGTDIAAFRAWRTTKLYSELNDPIETVSINGNRFLKASQADGVDHRSDYYYLVQPVLVYVFTFPNGTEMGPVTTSLGAFKLTALSQEAIDTFRFRTSTETLNELGEQHITGTAADAMVQLVGSIDRYAMGSPEPTIGGIDCGIGTRHDQLVALNAGEKRSLNLNDGLLITATPNIYGWAISDIRNFNSDESVVCGVATTVPRVVLDGWVLWWNQCVGGIQPTPAMPNYQQIVRCLQAQEVISRAYNLSD